MRARVVTREGGERLEFAIDGTAVIGRGGASTIRLPVRAISTEHAKIEFDAQAGRFVLEDLGSTNGTALDGSAVTGREPLDHLNVITLAGKVELVFVDADRMAARHAGAAESTAVPNEPAPAAAAPRGETAPDGQPIGVPPALGGAASPAEGATAPEAQAIGVPPALDDSEPAPAAPTGDATMPDAQQIGVPPALDDAATPPNDTKTSSGASTHADDRALEIPSNLAGGSASARDSGDRVGSRRWSLEIVDWSGASSRATVSAGDNLIGRSDEASIRIDSFDISRRHAVLTLDDGRFRLRDLGSKTGTFVDDRRITGEERIEPSSRLRFGNVSARILADDE